VILEALYRLAEREELIGDPDFEMKPVAWLVRVGEGGELLGIEDTHFTPPAEGKRKPKPQAKSMRVPRQPTRTSGDLSFFLCDKAEYALGADPVGDRPASKLAGRFALFRAEVQECLNATGDEAIRAVAALLDRVVEGRQQIALPPECASNDLFAFVYAPDVDRAVHERPAVRSYWKAQRRTGPSEGATTRQCIVTGEPFTESPLFPLLKKVPGGNTAGAALVSFNSNGFESYGWKGNDNAPISRAAAETTATALNRLLHPAYPDPRPETLGQPLARRHIRLGSDTAVCYWTASAEGDEFADAFGSVMEADDPERVGEMYRSIWSGRAPGIEDPSAFYALTLSGAQGRVMIRDWFESSVGEVMENLARHFDDLRVVRSTPAVAGREPSSQLPLRALLGALAPLGKMDEVPSPLASQFIRAGLGGTHYPLAVLQKAIERARAEIGRTSWADLERRDARAALIKAVLRRDTSHQELTPDMDPTNTEPGYLLGRLMAVLERLQQTALGDVNATIIDRYFGAASATPQAVFPRLLKNARHHARKGADEPKTAGTAIWLDRQIDGILAVLGVKKQLNGAPFRGFPAHLALDQQGLFVLGYHQQRHWLWMKKEDRERWAAEHGVSSPAERELEAEQEVLVAEVR
jgi:CRISPR-associated protein Csd1